MTTLARGTLIGPYTVLSAIGAGGMGEVYRARDTRLGRDVALKLLPDAFVLDEDRLARFAREAHVLASLNHPQIAAIYGVEQDAGRAALVLELVDGDTLAARLVHGALPVEEALGLARQIAEALEAAHERGVVHRDLKPANIMVTRGGVVKVLDFGLAKMADATSGDDVADSSTLTRAAGVTCVGTVLGTTAYMSPEQAQGRDADKRSDVWAFGCVLFEMLTGRPAFGRGSHADILERIHESEPDWTALPASTPPGVRLLMERCLRKDANRRPRHIDPFQLETSGGPAAAVQRRTGPWAAAAIGVAIAAAGLAWASLRGTPASPAAQPVVRLTLPFTAAGQPGEWNQRRLAVAPDGSSVVYVAATSDGRTQLYLRRTDRELATPLAGTEGAAEPFFSPDGAWVGFFAPGTLKKVSLETGLVQAVGDVRSPYGPAETPYGGAWGPDDVIVFGGPPHSGLMSVSASGGTPAALSELGPGEAVHRWPSLSPKGQVVVYTTSNSTGPGLEEPRIVAESLESGRREVLPVEATAAWFGPSGNRLLLARGGTLMSVAFDAARLTTSGEPVRLVEGVMQASTGAAQVASSSTMLAYMRGPPESRHLVWVDREGRIEPLDAPPRLYVHPRLSPDGQRIAVAITAPKNDIWMYDISRGTLSRLTFEGSNAYPIWTRDGTRITYVSARDDHPPNVFWKAADGTGAEERLLTSGNSQVTESWSPDNTLLFVEFRPGASGWDTLMLGLTGSRDPIDFLSTPFCDCTPQVSPTGRYVAYNSNKTGSFQLHVRSFPGDGLNVQVSSGGAAQAAWRGDERELYFRAGDAMMAVQVAGEPDGVTIGKPTVLFRGDFAQIQGKNYDVTGDGERFLMVRVDEPVSPGEISVVLNWRKEFDLERRSLVAN